MAVTFASNPFEDVANVALIGGAAESTKRTRIMMGGRDVGYIELSMVEGGTPPFESSAGSWSTSATGFPAAYTTAWGGATTITNTVSASGNALASSCTVSVGTAHTPTHIGYKVFLKRSVFLGWTMTCTGVGAQTIVAPTGSNTTLQALSASISSVVFTNANTSESLTLTPGASMSVCVGDAGASTEYFMVSIYKVNQQIPTTPSTLAWSMTATGSAGSPSTNFTWEATQTWPHATDGPWTDLSGDTASFNRASFRSVLREFAPRGKVTERCRIVDGHLTYKGNRYKLNLDTISDGACTQSTDAARRGTIEDLKARGKNLIRLQHIDYLASGGGICKTSPTAHWYELDSTNSGYLAETIKLIRAAGMFYTLNLNSGRGNVSGHYITDVGSGTDASDIVAGATSIQRFKQLPPVNAAADAQLKAFTQSLLALDVSLTGESGVTIGNDPACLYLTLTNEHFPSGTTGGDVGAAMDVWYGASWSESSAAARTAYAQACEKYYGSFKAWLTSTCGYTGFLAWGSEFGRTREEYNGLRQMVDVKCWHSYQDEAGVGNNFNTESPAKICTSVTNIMKANPLPYGPGPHGLEETGTGFPHPKRCIASIVQAVFAALNDWDFTGTYTYGDGTGVTAGADLRQYDKAPDRVRDIAEIIGNCIFGRGDLLPQSQSTSTNYAVYDAFADLLVVDTPKTLVLAGTTGDTYTFQRNQKITITAGGYACIAATTLDHLPIWESKRVLIAHLTDIQGRGSSWVDSRFRNCSSRGTTECVRHGTATIQLYSYWPTKMVVSKESLAGTRGATNTVTTNGNLWSITADIGESSAPLSYFAEVIGA